MRAKDSLNTFFSLSLALSLGGLVLTGCDDAETGDDTADSGTGEADDGGAQAAQFEVTVNYDGSEMGPLTVAAFTMWPPAGPPSAFEQDAEPSFPGMYSLSGLAPGEYTVVAILDLGEPSPTTPGDEDLQVQTDPITIEDGGDPIVVDLTLLDQ